MHIAFFAVTSQGQVKIAKIVLMLERILSLLLCSAEGPSPLASPLLLSAQLAQPTWACHYSSYFSTFLFVCLKIIFWASWPLFDRTVVARKGMYFLILIDWLNVCELLWWIPSTDLSLMWWTASYICLTSHLHLTSCLLLCLTLI